VIITLVEPVASGIAASLSHPGGNITGITAFTAGLLTSKMLELIYSTIPGLTHLAVLMNGATPSPALGAAVSQLQDTAGSLAIQTLVLDVRSASEFESAFIHAAAWSAQAMWVYNDSGIMIGRNYPAIASLALRFGMPTASVTGRPIVAAGGLMSYGPNLPWQFERAAYLVDRILRGANPGDVPIEQPQGFDFVVNTKTAQALGLTIPPDVAAQVTEWV
jgi:putative ABC transport system substrate-binding protein